MKWRRCRAKADCERKHCVPGNRTHARLTIREQVLPKSEAGQAIAYTLKNWAALARYCSRSDLSIDNNATERSLRSFAVGPQ